MRALIERLRQHASKSGRTRKQTEQELRRSEAHLAEAQRLGHVGSWAWNITTGELHWSLEHYRIFGVDPATFRPTLENTQGLIHPADMPRVRQTLDQAIRTHGDFEVDYRLIRPDGSVRYHHGQGHPSINESGDLNFLGIVVDVTDRKHAEEQLRRSEAHLAEGQRLSHTGSWALDVATGELFWSREHFRICGVDPETFTVTVEAARQLIHPEDRAAAHDIFDRAVKEETGFDCELRFLRPDGTSRHVRSLGRPVFNESGDLIEYIGTVLDITDRKEEETARRDLLRRLSAAQEAERRRISREMHDALGQELSALTLRLVALRREYRWQPTLDRELASLETIVRKLDRDADFIVWQLRPTALDDLGLVGALGNHVKTWSEHSRIFVEWHTSGVDAAELNDDIKITVYRILQEALNNVAKHAGATRVDILLEVHPDHVSLVVDDNGIGFDASQAFSLGQGGLGLVGMRERAALLGGTVDIESGPGDGTAVAARIPLPQTHVRRTI